MWGATGVSACLVSLSLLAATGCAAGGTQAACAELNEISADVESTVKRIDTFAANNELRNSQADKLKDIGYDILEVRISDQQLAEAAQKVGRGLISMGRGLDAPTVTEIDFDGVQRAGQRSVEGLNELARLCS